MTARTAYDAILSNLFQSKRSMITTTTNFDDDDNVFLLVILKSNYNSIKEVTKKNV